MLNNIFEHGSKYLTKIGVFQEKDAAVAFFVFCKVSLPSVFISLKTRQDMRLLKLFLEVFRSVHRKS